MAEENGPNVEEGEDLKLGFELLLTDLRLEILARLCESVDSKAQVVFDDKWPHANFLASSVLVAQLPG